MWTRFTFDPATDRLPIWSPDGSTIVFVSNRTKSSDLFQKASSGAGSEELLLESVASGSSWSLDGRFITYEVNDPKTGWDIWILPMNPDPKGASGDRKPFLFLQTAFHEARATFSPDGRWIAYHSNETGRREIYIRPFPGPGGKWQVSTNGGKWPQWRGDGKELFYLDLDNFITVAETNLGSSTVEIGVVRPLFLFSLFTRDEPDFYDVTADGQFFLVAEFGGGESSSPVTLVVNWLGQIKEK